MVLNRHEQEQKKQIDEKIMQIVLKKNVTYAEAKKMVEAGQSSLSDFRIR